MQFQASGHPHNKEEINFLYPNIRVIDVNTGSHKYAQSEEHAFVTLCLKYQ